MADDGAQRRRVAPAGTPGPVVQRLNAAFTSAPMPPASVEMSARLGAELTAVMTPAKGTGARLRAGRACRDEPIAKSIKFE